MTSTQDFLAGLTFVEGRGDATIDAEARTVGVSAPASSDLISDPVSGALTRGAPVLASSAPAGDFVFSAQMTVPGERSTYDAGVLALYVNERRWAKLCFEYSPDAEVMVAGVVTDGFSDDSNGDVIAGTASSCGSRASERRLPSITRPTAFAGVSCASSVWGRPTSWRDCGSVSPPSRPSARAAGPSSQRSASRSAAWPICATGAEAPGRRRAVGH